MPIQDASSTPSRLLLKRRHALALFGLAGLGLGLRATPAQAAAVVEKTVKVAPGLYELVVSSTTNLVHVASTGARGANNARIIGLDPLTLEQRSSIELGADGVFGLGVNDTTGTLFGTGTRNGKLQAINLRSGQRTEIGEGEGAHLRQVIVDEARNRAFVTAFANAGKPSAVWVVDTAANTVASVITEGLDGGITGIAHDPAGDRLFVTALMSNEIVEISLAKKAVVRRFASGGEGPVNIAFHAASGRLFCTNQKSGQLVVLEAASGQVVKALETGVGALGITLSGDGALAYVANRGAGTVSLVETRGLTVLASLPTGTHPNTVAVDRRSGLAYVTNKARMAPRPPQGQAATTPPGAPVEDPNGDTVSLIRA